LVNYNKSAALGLPERHSRTGRWFMVFCFAKWIYL